MSAEPIPAPRPENLYNSRLTPDEINFGTLMYPADTPVKLAFALDPAACRRVVAAMMALVGSHPNLTGPALREAVIALLEPLVPESAQSLVLDDDESHEWWAGVFARVLDPHA